MASEALIQELKNINATLQVTDPMPGEVGGSIAVLPDAIAEIRERLPTRQEREEDCRNLKRIADALERVTGALESISEELVLKKQRV